MKGIIYYYSLTGNTVIACKYISERMKYVDFDLVGINNTEVPIFNISKYDIVGFATFADWLAPPKLFNSFVKKLPVQNGKMAFIFNTYGNLSGKTLSIMKKLVKKKGFKIIGGHSLHTPENYPPLIANGMTRAEYPKKEDMTKFNEFISRLNTTLSTKRPYEIKGSAINIGFTNSLLPYFPRKSSKIMMGKLQIDKSRCNLCGVCEQTCAYQAVTLVEYPVFDSKKCYGCWACYNLCDMKAIYAKSLKKSGHYPGPAKDYIDKFK